MIRASSLRRPSVRLTLAILTVGLSAGCEDGAQMAFLQPKENSGGPAVSFAPQKTGKMVERDVEAPEVFQVSEAGLWDGRPSLGGIWVAHPDVDDPERVIIRNSANGKFVVGALFRRERDIPGPRVQASSDAAEALGMLAGAPVELNVTALRRETVAEPQPKAQTVALETGGEISETALDPIAGAAAAIEAAAAAPKTDGGAKPETDRKRKARAGDDIASGAKPARKTESKPVATASGETETGGKPPLSAARTPAAGTDAETGAVQEDADQKDAAEKPAKKKGFVWPWAKRNPTEAAPVDEVAAVTAAAAAVSMPGALPADAPAPDAKPDGKAKKSALSKPFIQIGIFSVQANAEAAADQMRRSGMVPTMREQTKNGKVAWRVLIGPTRSASERRTLLKKIEEIGFSDAYAVSN